MPQQIRRLPRIPHLQRQPIVSPVGLQGSYEAHIEAIEILEQQCQIQNKMLRRTTARQAQTIPDHKQKR